MTITATVGVFSSLACALLVLGGFYWAYGVYDYAVVCVALGAGWLGILQAGLLRLAAGTKMEPGSPAGTDLDRSRQS